VLVTAAASVEFSVSSCTFSVAIAFSVSFDLSDVG
jgi:hypothetical protein